MLFDNVSMSVFAGCLAHQWFLWHKDELGCLLHEGDNLLKGPL